MSVKVNDWYLYADTLARDYADRSYGGKLDHCIHVKEIEHTDSGSRVVVQRYFYGDRSKILSYYPLDFFLTKIENLEIILLSPEEQAMLALRFL